MTGTVSKSSISKIENPRLGDLLRCTREDIGISRAKTARRARVTENSLAKYEKAGYDGGQYPPSPKLAALCAVLNIDPATALMYSLGPDQIEEFGRHFMRYWIIDDAARPLEESVQEYDPAYRIDRHEMTMASARELFKLRIEIDDLRKQLKNDPARKEPGRSEYTTTEPEAVGAASTDQHGDDDR